MFTARWQLFRVRGIPINVDASWLIVLALLSWTMATYLQAVAPGLSDGAYWLLGLLTAVVFFSCIILHELGHALAAQRMGISIRGITLFLFGGVAEMESEPPSAGKEFLMAIAGPVVSALLAVAFWALALAGAEMGWATQGVAVMEYLAAINLAVLVFNLIPAFPLDGGRVLRAALWGATGRLRRATYWASLAGRGFAWMLIGLGILGFFGGQLFAGMWLVLIGLFLHSAALGSYEQVVARQALHGEPVRRFMNPEPVTVAPALDLRSWVEDYVYRYHHKTYPVVADGRLIGVISTSVLGRYPRAEWDRHTVSEAMRQDIDAISLPPDAEALQALEQMQRTGWSRLLVREDGHLAGLVSLKDLLRFLHLKLELEGEDEEERHEPPPDRPVYGRRETMAQR
jgi:Zn-dependent protease